MRFEFVIRDGRPESAEERTPPAPPRTFVVAPGQTLTLGRLAACDVRIPDEGASRRHCTLHARNGVCVVADLQSANGTFVNERRVATAELAPGDHLRIGATVIELTGASELDVAPGGSPPATLRLVGDPAQTILRRAIDPTDLAFLSGAHTRRDELALLEAAQRHLRTLQHVSDVLSRAMSVEDLFDATLDAIFDVTGGARAAVLLREGGADGLRLAGAREREPGSRSGDVIVSRTIVHDVLEQGVSILSHDATADARFAGGASIAGQRIRAVMCAPLRTADAILGVLYVDSHDAGTFDAATVELLAAVGNQAGVALHRTRLLTDMERLFLDVMKAIAAIIDAKDGYTHRHSERVAAFAVRLAAELGLSADERAVIELSALLHDVGKIGVPDAILNKPGKLTESEFAEMRRHPGHGARILANIQSSRVTDLLPGVKYHHERWDGSGYPDGLAGEAIPLLGRVLAVADFLDALSSDRAYRQALSLDVVVDMVREQSGRAFDPRVVDAAVALHARGALALPVAPGPGLG
ncbi:MAG: HD domain-containing phosphohydrolase [Vicinamibacterales bacterium]